jgi:signal transduction histidine kinase
MVKLRKNLICGKRAGIVPMTTALEISKDDQPRRIVDPAPGESVRPAPRCAAERVPLGMPASSRAPAGAALRRSQAWLAESERLSSTGSFSWLVATGEIAGSIELHRIFEFDETTRVTPEHIVARVHPDDRPSVRGLLECARSGRCDIEHEHRLLMPDKSVKYLRMVARRTRDQDGRLEYVGAVQDLTQIRLAETALGRARAQLAHVGRITGLGLLSASIAHEVNQPLSGIIINAGICLRMLTGDPPDVEGAGKAMRRMLRDCGRMSEVIARLRALFGKKEARIAPVDLNEATREVVALSLGDLQRNGVDLRVELEDGLPPVGSDRLQLQQVILNLLLNACEAMNSVDDRSRLVVLKTERGEGNRVRLSVKDSGAGLGSQAADRLFEPFYTTKTGGMGIGLFVSRSIIESHHGRLHATPNDGPGATFSFSLPHAPCPEGRMHPP